MANSNVPITAGAGTSIDTFTMASGDHRQAVVIGDPATESAAAQVTDVAAITGATQNGARQLWAGDALNTNDNAIQLATYKLIVKPGAAAVTANTLQFRIAMWHLAASTKTVRIRAIETNIAVSALAESLSFEGHYITAAPTGTVTAIPGGAVTRGATAALYPTDPGDAAQETQAAYTAAGMTVTSTNIAVSSFITATSTAALHGGGATVYNWLGGRFTKPLTMPAGVLCGFAFGFLSSAAPTLTPTVEVTFTEE